MLEGAQVIVEVEDKEGATHISLNCPSRANALSSALVEALLEAIEKTLSRGSRMLVLSGRGRTFCGGFDLQGLERETDESLAYRFMRVERLLQSLYYAPIYTVACAHGTVAGAGADLVTACSRRIASNDVTFRFPGTRFGVVLGTRRLHALIGNRARRTVIEQDTIRAREALGIGLIDELLEQDQWESKVELIAQRVASIPFTTVGAVNKIATTDGVYDFGLLAKSVSIPGLQERMKEYWNSVKVAKRTKGSGEL